MTTDNAAPPAGPDTDEYAWLRDGSVPHSREDRVAEVPRSSRWSRCCSPWASAW